MLCTCPSTWRESYTHTHAASGCCTPQRQLDGNWALTVLCQVMNTLLCEKVNSHLYVLTLEARDAELQAANAVKGGVVPMQVTDWQARVPGRVGDHDPLNPEGLIAKPFVAKYRDDKLVMQHDKAVTLHHWHVVSVFDNKSLGNEAFRVQGVMIPNPAWDTGLPVCDLHGHNTPLDRICSLHLCICCLESQHSLLAE
jgi:hypothetical protein